MQVFDTVLSAFLVKLSQSDGNGKLVVLVQTSVGKIRPDSTVIAASLRLQKNVILINKKGKENKAGKMENYTY